MSFTTASEKVARAFPEPIDREAANKYADWLQAAFAEIVKTARRTTTSAALLVVLFLLFVNAKAVDLTVGPAKITNVAEVLVLIPGGVSFLLYELGVLVFAYWRYEKVATAFFAHCFPLLSETDLETLIGPATPSLWGGEEVWQLLRAGRGGGLYSARVKTGVLTIIALAVAMVGFIVIAYAHIDEHLQVNGVLFWGSVGFSALNLFRATLLAVDEYWAVKHL